MKILHYLPYSYHIHTGGVEKIAQTIADGLVKEKGCESLIVASDIRRGKEKDTNDYIDTIFIPSFDLVHNFPVPKIWTKQFWKQFSDIKHYKPDIVLTHTRFFIQSLIGGIVAKWLGVKWVHVEHGSGFVTGYPWYIKVCAWLFDWTFGFWIFRQCDQIVTISQMHKRFIQKFTKKEPVVIYNPIDYTPQEKIKNDIPHIGFIGRLVSLKGVNLLIDALYGLQYEVRTCTIVGDGSDREKLEDQVKKYGLQSRIKFVGADDRNNWLHKFNILVNPSYQEGLPTTVVEGLLAGCVLIASDVGGTREISDKEDLILIQAGDIHMLQESIRKMLSSYWNLQKKSLDIVKERFDRDTILSKYNKILYHTIDVGKKKEE